jgi:hypothetical protein
LPSNQITPPKRTGYRRIADIPPTLLAALNTGEAESATLIEGLAIDFRVLLTAVAPSIPAEDIALFPRELGITKRMAVAGSLLLQHYGAQSYNNWRQHQSDTVRGFAAYLLAAIPDLSLEERLLRIRPLADDPHFGVREWAWLALRPHIAADIHQAITLLTPWVYDKSPYIRRFSVESTRPKGVWCKHIKALRENPSLGLPLLEPLHDETVKYVKDSVRNWKRDGGI